MKNNNSKKGFTLIEMLVVVAVISILSGLTLTGIAGFTARARDAKRVGDMRSMQTYFEAFFSKCGHYPGTSSSGTCSLTAPTTWGGIQGSLTDAIAVSAPKDPVGSKKYFYGVSPDSLKYIVGANLETNAKALTEPDDMGDASAPLTVGAWVWTDSTAATYCVDAAGTNGYGYCVGTI